MADKNVSKAIRKRIITGVVQAAVLFAIFWGVSFLQKSDVAVSAFHRAALFSILAIAGYTIKRIFDVTESTPTGKRWYNVGTALGMITAGFGFWQALVSFNEFRVWPGKLALIIFSGIIGIAVSRLAAYRGKRQGDLWWGIIGWLESMPVTKFFIGIAFGLYLVYLRPYLNIDKDVLMIFEWFLLCTLGLIILIRVWMGIGHNYTGEEREITWRKHQPQAEKLTGTSHDYMIRVERQFVSTGEAMGLYVLLIILLDDNRINEKDIVQSVEPLIKYDVGQQTRDKTALLSRGVLRRQITQRKEILKSTFDRISTFIQPHRSAMPLRSNVATESSDTQVKVTLDELKRHFFEADDKAGLLVRLTILLHQAGHYQEHIVSTLQPLTDGNDFALKVFFNRSDIIGITKSQTSV